MRAALRPATPASPFPCVQLVPAGKSSSPPASIAGPVRPEVPAPAAGSILGTSRAAGDPSLGAERLTPVFYSVHVFLMFVFMLKPECCSIRGADTSCPQQAVLVPSGLHFPLLGKAAREGWGCSLPKPHFWGLSWPLLLGCRGCSPQPLAVRGRSDTWALSQAFSVSCFCPGVLQWDLDPPALLPWLAACPVPSPPLLYSRGGGRGPAVLLPWPCHGRAGATCWHVALVLLSPPQGPRPEQVPPGFASPGTTGTTSMPRSQPHHGQLASQPSLGPALPQCPRNGAPRQLCAQLPPPQAPTLLLPRCGEPGEAPGLEPCPRLKGYTQGRLIYRQLPFCPSS